MGKKKYAEFGLLLHLNVQRDMHVHMQAESVHNGGWRRS